MANHEPESNICRTYTHHDATVVTAPMKVNVHMRYLSNNSIPRYLASVGNRRRSQSRKKSDAQLPLLKIPCNTVTPVLFLFPTRMHSSRMRTARSSSRRGGPSRDHAPPRPCTPPGPCTPWTMHPPPGPCTPPGFFTG